MQQATILSVLLVVLLGTLSSALSVQLPYCGGRGIQIPLLGNYSFWVTLELDSTGSSFAFRCDRDLHVSWCYPNTADFSTGKITQPAPCLTELLSKYQLKDFTVDFSGTPDRVRLSATAAPMGMELGSFEVQLTQQQCKQHQLGSNEL